MPGFRSASLFLHALLATFALNAAPAAACTLRPGEYPLNTLELAEQAEVVLLGVVRSGPREYDSQRGAEVVVRPTVLLKGASLPREIRLHAAIGGARSDPNELRAAHPQAYAGMCQRTFFVRGSTVLLFLTRNGGGLAPVWPPFTRGMEDVPSRNSRWVRAVRLYIEIAALPRAERRAALLARQAELRALTRDADAHAIAADIDRHLPTLSP